MSQDSLERFGAYRKAQELFDHVVRDTGTLIRDPRTHRLVSQQIACADSICANIEEGHGRRSKREYAQFLVVARGSARDVARMLLSAFEGALLVARPYNDVQRFTAAAAPTLESLHDAPPSRRTRRA